MRQLRWKKRVGPELFKKRLFQEPIKQSESSPFVLMTWKMAILEHQFQETLANQAWTHRYWEICEPFFLCYVFFLYGRLSLVGGRTDSQIPFLDG